METEVERQPRYDDFDLWLYSAGENSRTAAKTFSGSIFTPVIMSTFAGASSPRSFALRS